MKKWNAFKLVIPGLKRQKPSEENTNITDTYILFNREYSFYPEDYFRGMLLMERKRSERSRKPFMLMLLNLSKLSPGGVKVKVIKKLIKTLNTSTREIDIKGWYKLNLVMGILFTEFDGISNESLINKIETNLKETLTPEQFDLITIVCHTFPEDDQKEEKKTVEKNAVLYNSGSSDDMVKRISQLCKRGIDIAGSICGILLFSPFFIWIYAAIKATSKGPVFFKQKRVGINGKTFTLLKFRTMDCSNNTDIHKDFIKQFINGNTSSQNDAAASTFKLKDDPRITKIGKFLRKSSLDEIPQFFNVLWGDMSLVGPRPAIPYEVDEYDTWHKRRVLEVKPGITGIWQVKGRSRTDFDNMVRMDIQYIDSWSPFMDLKLIFQTPIALVTAKGAH